MWLIGSPFEIESCGCSQFREAKTFNLKAPVLRRRTEAGAFNGVIYSKGKRNGSCQQEDAEDAKKKSPCLFACELSSRIQFRSSLPEIFPGADGMIRKAAQDKAEEQWVSSCICLTIMRKSVAFGEDRVLRKMPQLFVPPHTCSASAPTIL